MSKRLLFVTTRLPWPQNSGRKVSLYHYCRGLAERYGYEIALFVFPEWDQPREAGDLPPFIHTVRFSAPISRARKCAGLLANLLTGKPLQAALYRSGKNRRLLKAFVQEFAPDVILFDMIRLAPYMEDLEGTARLILDLDDLLSRRYARQLAAREQDVSIAGHYAGGMSPALERTLCRGTLGRLVLRAERGRLEKAELLYSKKADGVILVSADEADHLNDKLGEKKAVAVPLGVDMAAFAANIKKRPRTFGFVGNLHVAANVASLDHIINDILPHVALPYTFEVVGPTPDEVPARFKGARGVNFLGEVEALAPIMRRWQLTLCPIAFGSGLKTKILEAMAAELPVLTNSVGAEGIHAENGAEIFMLDDTEALAETANDLLNDPDKCQKIGQAAGQFVAARFSWDHAFKAFQHLNL